jgi:hypothetical protein
MTRASTVVHTKQPPGASQEPKSWKKPRARFRLGVLGKRTKMKREKVARKKLNTTTNDRSVAYM